MSPLLPTPLLLLACAVGLALAVPRLRRPTSNARMAAEAFAVTLATCLGYAAAWMAWWWVEQRW
jgi:hypothetical protein